MVEWRDNKGHGSISSETRIGSFRVDVVYGHIYYKEQWVMTCLPLFDVYPLSATTIEAAKQEAIALLKSKIEPVFMELMKET